MATTLNEFQKETVSGTNIHKDSIVCIKQEHHVNENIIQVDDPLQAGQNKELSDVADEDGDIDENWGRKRTTLRKKVKNIIERQMTDNKCVICCEVFSYQRDLFRHGQQCHPKEKAFKCRHCNTLFSTLGAIRRHSFKHEPNRIFMKKKKHICEICSKAFEQLYDLKRHLSVHSSELPYSCTVCGKLFKNKYKCRLHEGNHLPNNPRKTHICEVCGKGFNCNTDLERHVDTHSDEQRHVCNLCGKRFKHSGTLHNHNKIHHSTGIDFKCRECTQVFSDYASLLRHAKTHDKKYVCQYCSKSFHQNSNLKKHERVHTGERPYPCNLCDKAFKTSSDMKTHQRKMHFKSKTSDNTTTTHLENHLSVRTEEERPSSSSGNNFELEEHIRDINTNDLNIIAAETNNTNNNLSSGLNEHNQKINLNLTENYLINVEDIIVEENSIDQCPSNNNATIDNLINTTVNTSELNNHNNTDHLEEFNQFNKISLIDYVGDNSNLSDANNNDNENSIECKNFIEISKTELIQESLKLFVKKLDITGTKDSLQTEITPKDYIAEAPIKVEFKLHEKRFKTPLLTDKKCAVCNKAFNFQTDLEKHALQYHRHGKAFKCLLCDERFPNLKAVSRHRELFHKKSTKKYDCDVCYKSFSYRSELNNHLRAHSKEHPYYCGVCDKSFKYIGFLRLHHETTHMEQNIENNSRQIISINRQHVCEYCSESFDEKDRLEEHLFTHTEEGEHCCTWCNKSFKYLNDLEQHQSTDHNTMEENENEMEESSICDTDSSSEEGDRLDDQTKESDLHTCILCYRSFLNLKDLKKHQKMHTTALDDENADPSNIFATDSIIKEHFCEYCSKCFDDQSRLRDHITTHTKVRLHSCTLCDKSYKYRRDLTKHQRTMHTTTSNIKNESEQIDSNNPNISDLDSILNEKVCPYCFKSFSARCQLKEHLKVHSKVRAYACDLCPRKYKYSRDLKKHEKTHQTDDDNTNTGDLDVILEYVCGYCSKAFGTKCRLKDHLLTHTKVRSNSCIVCNRSYKYRRDLRKHQNTRHTKEELANAESQTGDTDVNINDDVSEYSIEYFDDEEELQEDNSISNIEEELEHNCNVCNKSFKYLKDLKEHENSHNTVCENEIKESNSNDTDIFIKQSIIDDENIDNNSSSTDSIKKQSFSEYRDDESIVDNEEEDPLEGQLTLHTEDSITKDNVCEYCSKSFDTKYRLSQHLITHTDERAYACNLCDRKYKYKRDLRKHEKTHNSKDEQHVKIESTKDSKCRLNQHLITTPHERPHACNLCNRSYKYKRDLRKHEKTHNAKDEQHMQIESTNDEQCVKIESTNEEQHLEIVSKTNTSVIDTPIMKNHICEYCSKIFEKKSSLEQHLITHTDERAHICNLCNRSYKYRRDLKKHQINVHFPLQEHICEFCSKSFDSKSDLDRHLLEHPKERPYACTICEKTFQTKYTLKIHNQKIHDTVYLKPEKIQTEYACEHCTKVFVRKDLWKDHLISHSDERPYACTLCDKTFKQKRALNQHQYSHFAINSCDLELFKKNYVCEYCSKCFIRKNSLRDHLMIHSGARPYACRFCNKAFRQSRHLKRHENTHLKPTIGRKSYKCGSCGEHFPDFKSLSHHSKTHKDLIKKHICEFCSKSFNQASNLVTHLRVHTNERPYPCSVCEKAFKTSTEMKTHQRKIHFTLSEYDKKVKLAGIERRKNMPKNHICSICSMGFRELPTLKRHLRVHSNERPFVCTMCEKSFKYKSNLVTHEKSHMKEESLNVISQ